MVNNTSLLNHINTVTFDKIQVSVLVVILIASLLGNIFIISVIKRSGKIHFPCSLLILNLASCDILTTLSAIPFYLIRYIIYFESNHYPYGEVGCKVIWPFVEYAKNGSVFTLVTIAVERYLNMTSIKSNFTKRTSQIIILVNHIIAFVSVIPYSANLKYSISNNIGNCSEGWHRQGYNKAYTYSLFIMQYVFPLTMMVVFYFLAWRKLYIHNNSVIKMSEDYEKLMDWHDYDSCEKKCTHRKISIHNSNGETECSSSKPVSRLISVLLESNMVYTNRIKRACNMNYEMEEFKADENKSKVTAKERRQWFRQNKQSSVQETLLSMQNISCEQKKSTVILFPSRFRSNNIQKKIERFHKSQFISQTAYVRHKQSVRALKVFSITVVAFALFALPNQLSWLLRDCSSMHPVVSDVIVLLAYVTAVINCWIYGTFYPGIRKAYVNSMCCIPRELAQRKRTKSNCSTTTSLYDMRQESIFRRRMSFFDQIFEDSQKRQRCSFDRVSNIKLTS